MEPPPPPGRYSTLFRTSAFSERRQLPGHDQSRTVETFLSRLSFGAICKTLVATFLLDLTLSSKWLLLVVHRNKCSVVAFRYASVHKKKKTSPRFRRPPSLQKCRACVRPASSLAKRASKALVSRLYASLKQRECLRQRELDLSLVGAKLVAVPAVAPVPGAPVAVARRPALQARAQPGVEIYMI